LSIQPIDKIYSPSIAKCANEECPKLVTLIKRCAQCRAAIYCGRECQKTHWKIHKIECQPIGQMRKMNKIGEFSPQDCEVLGYSQEQIEKLNAGLKETGRDLLSKKTFGCFEFTLLEARERGVREQLFTPLHKDASIKIIMEERLSRWGYEIVDLPKAGDLVLYFNEKDLTHMGLYLKNGHVKSKPGNISTFFIVHEARSLCPEYGSIIVYCRKNVLKEGKYKEEGVPKFTELIHHMLH